MLLDPAEVLGEPHLLAEVSLVPPPQAVALAGEGEWTFDRPVEVHGLAYWFDLEVGEGTWLTNRPGGKPGSWGHLFLPAPHAETVGPREILRAGVAFDPGLRGEPGWMRRHLEAGGRSWSAHEFWSFLATASELEQSSPEWTPRLQGVGRAARRVLDLADGTRSLEVIVRTFVKEGLADTLARAEQLVHRTLTGRAG